MSITEILKRNIHFLYIFVYTHKLLMIFCYTLMYEEVILVITLSSLMQVIRVLSFFLDYSLGAYQYHKCF